MRRTYSRAACLAAAILALTAVAAPAQQVPPPPPDPNALPQGVDVLAQGPVHEAYAAPVDGQPTPGPVVPKQPPAPIDELPPDQKPEGDDVQWIPGYWAWDPDREDFLWVSGFWRVAPPGRTWVPGTWQQVADGGWSWSPGFWAETQQPEQQLLPPPPPTLDAGPSAPPPQEGMSYVPGCWVYRELRYWWRPGFWLATRPGWVWMPAHYVWTPAGCVFVEGFWDYPLANRGLLFAPVYVPPPVRARPWAYVPRYAVLDRFLMESLFVRAATRHYYFGDYFEQRYARQGYVPWYDYRINRTVPDPLYSYYVHQPPAPNWDREVRGLYAARYQGEAPRPPRTLTQQTRVLRQVTNNPANAANVSRVVQNLTAVAPLNQIDKRVTRLEAVNRDLHQREVQQARQLRKLSQQRREVQQQVVKQKAVPTRPADRPQPLKIDVKQVVRPQPKAEARPNRTGPGAVRSAPPPPPALPRHEDRPHPKQAARPPAHVEPRPAIPPRKEVQPPRKQPGEPLPPKKEVAPVPPKKEVAPVPPKKKEAPTPLPPRKEVQPPKKEFPTPVPPKKEVTPAPKYQPPAPPKHEATPQPPKKGPLAPPPPHVQPAPPRPAPNPAQPPPRPAPTPTHPNPAPHPAPKVNPMPPHIERQPPAPRPSPRPQPQPQPQPPKQVTPPPHPQPPAPPNPPKVNPPKVNPPGPHPPADHQKGKEKG